MLSNSDERNGFSAQLETRKLLADMKLQFKEQGFQVNAVQAVVDCFEGQALKTNVKQLLTQLSPESKMKVI